MDEANDIYVVIFKEWGHCDNPTYWDISEFDNISDALNYVNNKFAEDMRDDMELMGFYKGTKVEFEKNLEHISILRKEYLEREKLRKEKELEMRNREKEDAEKRLYEKLKSKYAER